MVVPHVDDCQLEREMKTKFHRGKGGNKIITYYYLCLFDQDM